MQSDSVRDQLDSLRDLLQDDLKASDNFIISQLESNIPMVKEILEYVLSCGGKRIRPMVLMLSARALTEKPDKHVDLAAVIELIHTATLLHDDVVDGSTLRRGHETAHTIWGSDASILVGDFLYSRAFQIVVNFRNQQILDIFAHATHYIAEGEIMQLVNCHNADTTEDYYFEIIKRKTAKLFEIAAQLGALVVSDEQKQADYLKEYGLHFGLAYQLIDDAIDYSNDEGTAGKNVGQDLAEGKMTLPLIYAMQKSNEIDRQLIKKAIESGSDDNIKKILSIIKQSGAIEYTAKIAKKHSELAIDALKHLPDSPYLQALKDLCYFVVERRY